MNANNQELLNALEDMCYQFGYQTVKNCVPALSTGGLSVLENAFYLLGWEDPHPCPQSKCEISGCNEWATCGTNTPKNYVKNYLCCCGKHFGEIQHDLEKEKL